MIRHSETAKMSRTSSFSILGGQLASPGGRTLFSDSLKLLLYQHRSQLNLLKVEAYLKPPHLNIALWAFQIAWKGPQMDLIAFAFQWEKSSTLRHGLLTLFRTEKCGMIVAVWKRRNQAEMQIKSSVTRILIPFWDLCLRFSTTRDAFIYQLLRRLWYSAWRP